MEKYNKVFEMLNNAEISTQLENQLIHELKRLGDIVQAKPDMDLEIAYKIAGFMATDYVRFHNSNKRINEIFTIAGELEINPEDRDELRKELIEKINSL